MLPAWDLGIQAHRVQQCSPPKTRGDSRVGFPTGLFVSQRYVQVPSLRLSQKHPADELHAQGGRSVLRPVHWASRSSSRKQVLGRERPSARASLCFRIHLGPLPQVGTQTQLKKMLPPWEEAKRAEAGTVYRLFFFFFFFLPGPCAGLSVAGTHGTVALASGSGSRVEKCLLHWPVSPSDLRMDPVSPALPHGAR